VNTYECLEAIDYTAQVEKTVVLYNGEISMRLSALKIGMPIRAIVAKTKKYKIATRSAALNMQLIMLIFTQRSAAVAVYF
jgi:hypothetical protein